MGKAAPASTVSTPTHVLPTASAKYAVTMVVGEPAEPVARVIPVSLVNALAIAASRCAMANPADPMGAVVHVESVTMDSAATATAHVSLEEAPMALMPLTSVQTQLREMIVVAVRLEATGMRQWAYHC